MLAARRIEPSLSADLLYQFPTRPRHVFVVKKETSDIVNSKASLLSKWLRETQHVTVFIEQAVYDSEQHELFEGCCPYVASKHRQMIELVITLGGDGTVLHANSLFNDHYPTPVLLSFAMGTLGFLTPFNFDGHQTVITQLLSACSTINKASCNTSTCTHLSTSDESASPCKNNGITGMPLSSPSREPQKRSADRRDSLSSNVGMQHGNGCVISLCPRMRLLCQVWKRRTNRNDDRHDREDGVVDSSSHDLSDSSEHDEAMKCDPQQASFVGSLQTLHADRVHETNDSCGKPSSDSCNISEDDSLFLASTFHPLNEILLSNATSRNLTSIDLSLIQENGKAVKVSTVLADALIISTATGSTAYSMSAGGPMVSPNTHVIIVTPVCPHSLSFRPLILPDSTHLLLSISASSRSDDGLIVCDGSNKGTLKKGEWVTIKQDSVPVWSVNWVGKFGDDAVNGSADDSHALNTISNTDEVDSSVLWFRSISSKLNWNQSANQPVNQMINQSVKQSHNVNNR